MPTILLKKSDTPGSVPGTANLTNLAGGVEVAVNTADKRVYSMTSASAVIELGTNPSSLTCSDVSATVLRAGSATITNLLATTLTVSGGTANGVLYLNGSKVATSGSALVFDGTDFKMPNGGSMLLGASASGASLLLINGTAAAQRLVLGTSGTDAVINATRTSGTSPNLLFQLEGANSMALTSTGLGIGTASPAARLHVSNGSNSDSGDFTAFVFGGTDATNSRTGSIIKGTSTPYNTIFRYQNNTGTTSGSLIFQNGSTSQLTLDSSGNLGLGVTPTNNTLGKTLQVGQAGAWVAESGSNRWWLASNWYYNSGDKYINNGFATLYSQQSGQHQWLTAASGTINTAISFTQAMTLDASGNLAVGTTTVDEILRLNGSSNATARIRLQNQGTTLGWFGSYLGITALGNGNDLFVANATNNALIFGTNGTERARITSGGNFGINTTDPTQKLEVVGGIASTGTDAFFGQRALVPSGLDVGAPPLSWRFYTTGTTYTTGAMIQGLSAGAWSSTSAPMDMRFYTVPSSSTTMVERARFTAGGYFKASNTGTYLNATGAYHELRSNDTSYVARIDNSHPSSPDGAIISFSGASPDNNTEYFLLCTDTTADRCYIWSDGDLANHDGVYGTISDARLKQDIVDAGSQWDDLKAIRFRKYRMKTDVEANPDAPAMFGVVAQELAQVCPGLVDEHPNMKTVEVTDEEGNVTQTQEPDGTTTMTVKSSILLMKAAKALQEAMARIESLEAKVAALEAK